MCLDLSHAHTDELSIQFPHLVETVILCPPDNVLLTSISCAVFALNWRSNVKRKWSSWGFQCSSHAAVAARILPEGAGDALNGIRAPLSHPALNKALCHSQK